MIENPLSAPSSKNEGQFANAVRINVPVGVASELALRLGCDMCHPGILHVQGAGGTHQLCIPEISPCAGWPQGMNRAAILAMLEMHPRWHLLLASRREMDAFSPNEFDPAMAELVRHRLSASLVLGHEEAPAM